MRNTSGKRLAVIVNEFGDVGVDGEILKSCAIPDCPAENIMELAMVVFVVRLPMILYLQLKL